MKHLFKAISAGSVFLAVTAAGATITLASPAYELTVTTPGARRGQYIYRIDVASGQVSEVGWAQVS